VTVSRRRRRARLSTLVLTSLVLASLVVLPGLAAATSNFEANDGNLVVNETGNIDWNSFAGTSETNPLIDAWRFTRIDDDTGNKDNSIYVQNTKDHQFECPNIGSGSMGGGGNKDDLKRLYLATQSFDDGDYLYLAWTRVNQNSTTASANLSFEFNQSDVNCNEGGRRTNQLKYRTDGDLLVLYDFFGGEGRVEISISEWNDAGPCEVGNHTPPCWGPVQELTVQGAAVGAVNVGGPVMDAVAGETLGTVAFGEGAINLTKAGIFDPDEPECKPFGAAAGMSRSSGNSISSSLSDLIGPAAFELSNCGSLTIEKVTDPAGADDEFDFTIDPAPPAPEVDQFTLTGEEGNDAKTFNGLFANTYTVEETPAAGWDLSAIVCEGNGIEDEDDYEVDLAAGTVDVDVTADSNITCTFTNTARGTIVIEKETDPADLDDLFGFTASPSLGDGENDVTFDLAHGEQETFSDVPPGTYAISEDDPTPAFDLTGLSCTDEDDESGASQTNLESRTATINLDAGETVTCTFTNTEQPTSILIVKTTQDPDELLADAKFELTELDKVTLDPPILLTEDPDGVHCADGLARDGSYTVSETPPTGYEDVPDFTVIASNFATCAERLAAIADAAGEDGPDPGEYSDAADDVVENVPLPISLTVNKWKLSFENDELVTTEVPLTGFDFTLYEGADDTGTEVDTQTTVDGSATFADLIVGTEYTVCEEGVPTGQTGYWSDGGCQTFTAELDTDEELDFYNAPRADVSIGFTDVTGYTSVNIVCTDGGDEVVGSDSYATTDTLDLSQLDLGDYDCTIEVRNGTTPDNGGEG
jgi:hypothetical protein